jgi:maltooligosyltrehalose trehalohydrolase
MTAFRVWAPRPARVELALGDSGQDRRAMTPASGDWWTLVVPEAGPGTDYGFVLDGDGPFPDPRSASQPNGVHGLSRLVDHDAFAWNDQAFEASPLPDAVLYELHVGTFTERGTFEAAIERLDHLVALGVTHVELLPIVEFPGDRGWGYDGVDLFAPHHALGGPDGLKHFVDACHGRGLAVVLDVVYNHLGPDGNYLARYGPYFSERYRTPWGEALNFDGPGAVEVRRFVIDNARHWVETYHVDALRLDAVHEIFDRSAIHILEELGAALDADALRLRRAVCVIAESDLNDPRLVRDVAGGGYGLDAQWNDDFRHSLHVALTGERDDYHSQYRGIHDLAAALHRIFVFDDRYSAYRGRRHGRPVPPDIPTSRFVGFLQNHDQVGNRPFGERSAHLLTTDQLRTAAALVILGPFVPLLFFGEEWAASTPFRYFTDHRDPVLAEAVRRGRREEFKAFVRKAGELPDPQNPATRDVSRLDWAELEREPHRSMLDWHRRLLAYRRAHSELRSGARPSVRYDEAACWLTMDQGPIKLAANLSPEAHPVPLDQPGPWTIDLASADDVRLGDFAIDIPAWSVAVLRRRA